jgi:IS605 OrfB family transposase
VNHCVSKRIVEKAKALGCGIALEDLKGIRQRTEKTVKKQQRRQHSSRSFYQLRKFMEYKAAIAGVRVVLVHPKNTSRTCPICGHVAKENRPSRDQFCCRAYGYAVPADNVAAENIRRAAVNQPNAAAN